MNKQLGISLSEVLISLFLSSLLLTVLIQFYVTSKKHYLDAEKMLAAHFEVDWVSDLLSDSIRRAGFTPCLSLEHLKRQDSRHSTNNLRAITINPAQQLFQINRMDAHFYKVEKIINPHQILLSQRPAGFNAKRPLLIADCYHAEVQQIVATNSHLDKTRISLRKPLEFSYGPETYVGEFLEEQWFIKSNGQGQNTLHYRLAHTEELTPLIHSLIIKLSREKGRQFVEVILGLEQGKTYTIKVMVRGS